MFTRKAITFLLTIAFSWTSFAGSEALKYLPVQDAGRIKPFDTFSRDAMQLIYGRKTYEGKEAVEIILTWMLYPAGWKEVDLFEITHKELKKGLKLDPGKKRFRLIDFSTNPRVALVMQELNARREAKEKLDPYYQAAQRLENQLFTFQEIISGRLVRIAPKVEGDTWASIGELKGELREKFGVIPRSFVREISKDKGKDREVPSLDQAVKDFKAVAKNEKPEAYPSEMAIRLEVHYNSFHPFRGAWILYLLAVLAFVFSMLRDNALFMRVGWVLTSLGFIMHTYGFALRSYLTGRAPVTNMYETVVWVSWGVLLFAVFLERHLKKKFIILMGGIVSVLCLVVADTAPIVLDPSLQQLEPVLRSNYWLTIHVLTITISYAAFFLAMGLGDLGLFYIIRGEKENSGKMRDLVQAIYRCLQIGVVLLAAGIILGGWWADYSWGRFWGWDPKETWALIALLGYIAVLHGRLVGYIRNFGMLLCSIATFSLVLMAWYGVNFVLGAGLHSYGFGGGGIEWVSGFVFLHFAYMVFAFVVRQNQKKIKPTES